MIVNRQDINDPLYREILEKETHHNHVIIEDEHGIIRWEPNLDVMQFYQNISLDDLCPLLHCMGYGKNSEVYRKLYRDIGYSLSRYHEMFYEE